MPDNDYSDLYEYVLSHHRCPFCDRELLWGTLPDQCRYCYGIYIQHGQLRVDIPPIPSQKYND